jgi:hypothetical protein
MMLVAHKPMPDGLYYRVYYALEATIMRSIEPIELRDETHVFEGIHRTGHFKPGPNP